MRMEADTAHIVMKNNQKDTAQVDGPNMYTKAGLSNCTGNRVI